MMKRRIYTKEFKEDAVNLLRNSTKTITAVSIDLGIDRTLLSRWNKEFDQENAFPGNGNPKDVELFELKKELAQIKEERDILKKALAIFSKK